MEMPRKTVDKITLLFGALETSVFLNMSQRHRIFYQNYLSISLSRTNQSKPKTIKSPTEWIYQHHSITDIYTIADKLDISIDEAKYALRKGMAKLKALANTPKYEHLRDLIGMY